MPTLDVILKQATTDIQSATDLKSLDHYRVQYLGKKGQLTEILKTLGQLSSQERPIVGQKINEAKQHIQTLLANRETILKQQAIETQLLAEKIDVALPGRGHHFGSLHPITQTMEELQKIFSQKGFLLLDGPEIEDDYHNFTALNIPLFHPARAMQDTFYFPNGLLLRSQTSTVQIRAMKTIVPPLRIVTMGRVYRRDFDLTHTPMFHQLECLMIDENLSMANLKALLHQFLREFFGFDVSIRLRPSYFPFTEPSAEVDIGCLSCKSKGCRLCKQAGWVEILGCGMVHPNVLKEAGIDTARYNGFALGVGVDRLALLKYRISDLRALFENDLRFLRQF